MQWILLAAIIAALLFLSRFFPKVGFGILGLLAVGAAIIVMSSTDYGKFNRSKLPLEDIVIENPVMVPAYRGSYQFKARLNNLNNSIELKRSLISITMLDCSRADDSDCKVIGQEAERINLAIPPKQSRDVSQSISFSSVNPIGLVRWKFKVIRTHS